MTASSRPWSLAAAVIIGQADNWSSSLLHALREIGVGALIGVGIGLATGWILALAVRRGWAEPGHGHCHASRRHWHVRPHCCCTRERLCRRISRRTLLRDLSAPSISPRALELTEGAGQLLASLVWFAFGAAMLRPSLSDPGLLRCLVVRRCEPDGGPDGPGVHCALRTRLGLATSAFIGWFGPRGLASVIFALLASDELGHQADTLLNVVSITVACSIILHGVSANPLIARYSALSTMRQPDHPLSFVAEVPTARRSFGRIQPPGDQRVG